MFAGGRVDQLSRGPSCLGAELTVSRSAPVGYPYSLFADHLWQLWSTVWTQDISVQINSAIGSQNVNQWRNHHNDITRYLYTDLCPCTSTVYRVNSSGQISRGNAVPLAQVALVGGTCRKWRLTMYNVQKLRQRGWHARVLDTISAYWKDKDFRGWLFATEELVVKQWRNIKTQQTDGIHLSSASINVSVEATGLIWSQVSWCLYNVQTPKLRRAQSGRTYIC